MAGWVVLCSRPNRSCPVASGGGGGPEEYATIVVVALDDQPLAESAKVLVQVGTTQRTGG